MSIISYGFDKSFSNTIIENEEVYELLLCLSDGMFLTVDGEEHEIRKNTLLIFNSVDLHQFGTKEPEGENKRYVLYFDPSYVDYLSSERVSLLECSVRTSAGRVSGSSLSNPRRIPPKPPVQVA